MAPGGQLGGGKSSKVDWGVTEKDKPQREEGEKGTAEGNLKLLMRSLDISEHLHVLKVYMHVFILCAHVLYMYMYH